MTLSAALAGTGGHSDGARGRSFPRRDRWWRHGRRSRPAWRAAGLRARPRRIEPGTTRLETPDGQGRSRPPGRLALLAQLAAFLAVGAALGALVPRVGVPAGLAGGLLGFVAAVGSMLLRVWWRHSSQRHPQWSRHGPELLAREVVRAGVSLLVVLFALGPFVFGSGPLPAWVLAAVAAGVACSLPAGVLVGLRTVSAADGAADRRRLWRGAVGIAGTAALALSLLAVLAGLVAWQRALAWSATALATFALTAWVRGTGRLQRPA